MAKVIIYTRTYCPYCSKAKHILDKRGIPYTNFDVDSNIKNELFTKTGQNTVPYIFIDDNFIGGCSDLEALEASGKLDEMCEKI